MAEGQLTRRWVGGLRGHHGAVHDELEVGDDVLRRAGGQLDLEVADPATSIVSPGP